MPGIDTFMKTNTISDNSKWIRERANTTVLSYCQPNLSVLM